jgi:CRISPR-associated endonuclease/helicase Cas3
MVSQSFFAHSLQDKDTAFWQKLNDHLCAVARLAGERGRKFESEATASRSGLLHDLGKYTQGFQNRLRGGERVDHSTAGASEVLNYAGHGVEAIMAQLVAHCIAGHHAGLPNSLGDLDDRLKQSREPLDPQWREEIAVEGDALRPPDFRWKKENLAFQFGFLGRMIFSCLVDADFRDTEEFYAKAENTPVDREWPRLPEIVDDLIARLDSYMGEKRRVARDTAVNRLRSEIFNHVRAGAALNTGVFSLNVPTGGGKTLASLAFALDHARRHGLERIVYAIPFTSVIDQTAAIFKGALGDSVILEHHSSIDEEKIGGRDSRDKLRLAMEDWAAPLIVTTNVQLFESLHSHRPSRCRRLHNLARSVIILDEAQTIPLAVLRPCVAALDELATNYQASIVICTATQPAIMAPDFAGGLPLVPDRELAPDPRGLHEKLTRVRIIDGGAMDNAALCADLAEHRQGLVIVNSRAHALALYRDAKAAGLEGCVHLTTRHYGLHRREILSRVRVMLAEKEPCRLIATSLVEAGVDVDFPRVWRAEAGLDQIAQAAGRCNREGARPIDESIVKIFQAPDHPPPREMRALAQDMARVRGKHADLLAPDALRDYFGEVYWRKGDDNLDKFGVLKGFAVNRGELDFSYRTIGENFRLIESAMAPVIVPADAKAREALDKLRAGWLRPGAVARALQNYIVQVPPRAREKLLANGHVSFVAPKDFGDQFAVLMTDSLYHKDFGLFWEDADYLGLENFIV